MERLQEEIFSCVQAFLGGIAPGVLYQMLYCVRQVLPHKDWLVSLEDVLFWTATGVMLAVFFVNRIPGGLRWYLVCCTVLGGAGFTGLFWQIHKYIFKKLRNLRKAIEK